MSELTMELNNVPEDGANLFWQEVEESINLSRSSAGTICKVDIAFGYKIFGTGKDKEDPSIGWFPVVVGDKKSMAEARRLAGKFVVDNSLNKNPFYCFLIKQCKDTVLNAKEGKTYDKDRWMFTPTFSAPYVSTIAPKLQSLGVARVGEMWVRLSWESDLSEKAKKRQRMKDGQLVFDENGQPVMDPPLFAYISEVFNSKEEALEAAGVVGDTSEAEQYPAPYTKESWPTLVAEVKNAHKNSTPLPKIASDYALDMAWVTKIISS